jgi:hypothetical protein
MNIFIRTILWFRRMRPAPIDTKPHQDERERLNAPRHLYLRWLGDVDLNREPSPEPPPTPRSPLSPQTPKQRVGN